MNQEFWEKVYLDTLSVALRAYQGTGKGWAERSCYHAAEAADSALAQRTAKFDTKEGPYR